MSKLTEQQIIQFEAGICPYCQKPLGKQTRADELIYVCQSCDEALDLEELNLAWSVWKINCDSCLHHWVAVAPVQTKNFECPKCRFTDKRARASSQ